MTHIWLNVYLYILNYKHVKCKPIKSCYICALYIYKYMSCIFLGGIMFNAGWKFVRGLVFSCTSHWLFPLVLGPWHARLTQTPCCYVDTHTQAHMGFTTWPLCSIEKTGCLQSFKPETDTSMDLWTKTAKENRKQNTTWNYHGIWQSPPHPLKLHHVVEDFPWGCVASS